VLFCIVASWVIKKSKCLTDDKLIILEGVFYKSKKKKNNMNIQYNQEFKLTLPGTSRLRGAGP
jgi:hypothetical protein